VRQCNDDDHHLVTFPCRVTNVGPSVSWTLQPRLLRPQPHQPRRAPPCLAQPNPRARCPAGPKQRAKVSKVPEHLLVAFSVTQQDPKCQDPEVRCQDPVVRFQDPLGQNPVVRCQDPVVWCQDPVSQDPVVRYQDPVEKDTHRRTLYRVLAQIVKSI
ncbi:hypothetical protein V8C86DRAFT_3035783, partial [Haematococcus lacustris]